MSEKENLPEDWAQRAAQNEKKYKRWLSTKAAKKAMPRLHEVHEEVFRSVDCLDCAACCTHISPRFKTPDVRRIAKHLGLRESVFIDRYLRVDEDGDFVVKSSPCPFLGSDHYCSIYELRPRDCSRYPYTDSDQLIKRPQTTLSNSQLCPAVFLSLEKLMQ